jgi:acyl-coenzyme A synthetase/AMP-(fatty) acid ligase
VGTVIGTGVFLKTAVMAQDVGSPGLVLAAWVAAGLLSLAGALTYAELHRKVNQAANALRSLGLGKGDAVGLYMPMIPELVIALLAVRRRNGRDD